jgi:hypothetical protein
MADYNPDNPADNERIRAVGEHCWRMPIGNVIGVCVDTILTPERLIITPGKSKRALGNFWSSLT